MNVDPKDKKDQNQDDKENKEVKRANDPADRSINEDEQNKRTNAPEEGRKNFK